MSQRCIWKNPEEMGQKNQQWGPSEVRPHQQLSASLPPSTTRDKGKSVTFWHNGQTSTNQTRVTHKRSTLFLQNGLYLQRNLVQSESTFPTTVRSDEKVVFRMGEREKSVDSRRDRCELGCKFLCQPCSCCSDTPGIPRNIWKVFSAGLIQHLE